jgi:hypothetical protein
MKLPSGAIAAAPARLSVIPANRRATKVLTEKGLPANIDAEKLIIGSALLDGRRFGGIAAVLKQDHFALEKHRRIFVRMSEIHARGDEIDRVTLANELQRYGELESVNSLSYLITLDDGLPQLPHLDGYIRIICEKATLRRIAIVAQHLVTRALLAKEHPVDILKDAESQLAGLHAGATETGRIEDLPSVGALQEVINYIREPELPEGAIVALTRDSGFGKSTLATPWALDAIAAGRPVLILDRENPRGVVLDRMQRLGLTDGPLLRWVGGWIGQEVPGPDTDAVIGWVKACQVRPLLVIDSLVSCI